MAEFEALVEAHRGELRVHCYRMLGSYDEAEDLVQETFLRAWKGLDAFEGRSSVRAWLYKIATNACLDALDGKARRVLPFDVRPGADPQWLQPFPDRLATPDEAAVSRETMELAFLAAVQHLPPRQRAALILRDVLGWSARDAADLLDASVPSLNSALQRARATLRSRLPEREDWPRAAATDEERAVLRRYMAALERADVAAVAELLAEDVRTAMPPFTVWFEGRGAVVDSLARTWDPGSPHFIGRLRAVPVAANRQPAVATYVRAPGDDAFRPFAISLLEIVDGRIASATAFHEPHLFPAFGLPMTFSPGVVSSGD